MKEWKRKPATEENWLALKVFLLEAFHEARSSAEQTTVDAGYLLLILWAYFSLHAYLPHISSLRRTYTPIVALDSLLSKCRPALDR